MRRAMLSLLLIAVVSLSFQAGLTVHANDFDFWAFSLYWAPTVCLYNDCLSEACDSNPPRGFTIDGLWPLRNGGAWPNFCDCSKPFNRTMIEGIENSLGDNWPSLNCSYSPICNGKETHLIWAYQWERYGTCGTDVLENEMAYFYKALELYSDRRFQLQSILQSAGIYPSNYAIYITIDISEVVKKATGKSPWIKCQGDYLGEIRLCFTDGFELQDCRESFSSCTNQVKIPTYEKLAAMRSITQVTS